MNNDICFYCEKEKAENGCFKDIKLYQIIKKKYIPLGYDYKEVTISIPRCKSCFEIDGKESNNNAFLVIIIFILYLSIFLVYNLYIHPSTNNSSKANTIFLCFLGTLALTVLTYFVLKLLWNIVIKELYYFFSKKERPLDIEEAKRLKNDYDYPQIKHLLDLGYKTSRKDPANVTEDDIAKDSPYHIDKSYDSILQKAIEKKNVCEYDVALKLLLQLKEENPKDIKLLYNLSCIYSLQNETSSSLLYLKLAIQNGFINRDKFKNDSDLDNLRNSQCYKDFILKNK